ARLRHVERRRRRTGDFRRGDAFRQAQDPARRSTEERAERHLRRLARPGTQRRVVDGRQGGQPDPRGRSLGPALSRRAREAIARGPVPLTAYAGTQTAKTGLAVQALLENLKRISTEPTSNEELDTARRYLADVFAIRMETVGAVSDMVVSLRVLGLPDDYYD